MIGTTKTFPCGCQATIQARGGMVTFGPILCAMHAGRPMSEWPQEVLDYYDVDEDEVGR